MQKSLGRQIMGAVCAVVLVASAMAFGALVTEPAAATDMAALKGGYRKPAKNGWTYVHLQGTPREIGYQNGYLLAPEIDDTLRMFQLELTHDNHKDWQFFRTAAEKMMWPRIEDEYRQELQGIADGARARGVKLDLWDVVAMNAALEWSYYVAVYDKAHGIKAPAPAVAEHCSAFVATGSYTKDHKIVIAHNNWSSYLDGVRWRIIYDIAPPKGHHVLMDGIAGVIHSADDFGMNDAGLVITETTIGRFKGFDEQGIPEFVRARKAMQYAETIDDFARIMGEGNNGGYANSWLVGDTRHNEIARLELGLKNVTLERTKDGVFIGSNFPIAAKLVKEETDFDPTDMSASGNARHLRWDQLMAANKGRIDVALAEGFLADHYDTYEKKEQPSERTLDGHPDLSPRGYPGWVGPYGTVGAVQNKVADAKMVRKMSLVAAAGHACGMTFKASEHLAAHPDYNWQKPSLKDMDAQPWTKFKATK